MAARAGAAAGAAVLGIVAFASPLAEQKPTFRSAVHTVPLYATVTDREGRLVPDLDKDAFRILDNGHPADVTVFSNDVKPITVALMLDTSGSMAGRVVRVGEATGRFIDALAAGDRARIGTFGWEVSLSPMLTGNKETLRRVLGEEVWPGGPTPLWRATHAAMTSLEGESGRRVVLLLTDGEDNDQYKLQRPKVSGVKDRAERDGFMVYAIGMFRSQRAVYLVRPDRSTATLANGMPVGGLSDEIVRVVEETGGGHFEVQKDGDLESTFARVTEELRHQYQLGFSPATLDGKVHKLEVLVKTPGCRVRARKSYVAEETR